MTRFRIFIASPVYEFEEFRKELIATAREAEDDRMFEFCFFEKDYRNPIQIRPNMTATESIFDHFGGTYDAFFLAFRNRVGSGTRAEFNHWLESLRSINPACELWWRQVDCDSHDADTNALLTVLHGPHGNTGMQRKDAGPVDTPDRLANLFASQLLSVSATLRDGTRAPFSWT